MQNRMKLFLNAVLLIAVILSMATFAFAAETETTTEHVHTWETLSATKTSHYMICATCNQTRNEHHTFNSEEICTACGRYFHTHKWQRIKADSQLHTVVCAVCGESETVTHSMREGVCTVCGYETHTHIMQYVGGENYGSSHATKCTLCDAIGSEQHTYGNDDKCTVCGGERPCEHQWKCNGEQYLGQHVMACACGQTMTRPHSWTWNAEGNYAVCTACLLKDSGHWHKYIYPDGTRCIECGYEKTPHIWRYGNSFNQDHHVMVCKHCGITESELHCFVSDGRCLVCGYHNKGTVKSETQPNGTKPAETEPAESKPVDTEPAETEPTESEPVEIEPMETDPTEAASVEANPAETKPEASETIDEEDGEADSQSDSSTLVWVVAVVFIAVGLTAGLFLWKKKSS